MPLPASPKHERVEAVDLLRGAVMIIMALDHSRDFLSSFPWDPTDLAHTTPAYFATRWITHFCAPVFMLLAGAGARLSLTRGRTPREAAWFLFTRGLFLVLLDATLIKFGWFTAEVSFLPILGSTLWGLGWAMMVLAGLTLLPLPALAAISAILVLGHDAFDHSDGHSWGTLQFLWVWLHGGAVVGGGRLLFFNGYPPAPWAGVMGLGYVLGEGLARWTPPQRTRRLLALGLSLAAGFVLLRASNLYGDPRPWHAWPRAWQTFAAFINCEKYPPSLLFLLMTLGPAIACMPALERLPAGVARVVRVYGRVPMFYYVLHIYLLHGLALLAAALLHRGIPYAPTWGFQMLGMPAPANVGFGLGVVYAAWLFAVVALYPACRWYLELKRTRHDWWLSYV